MSPVSGSQMHQGSAWFEAVNCINVPLTKQMLPMRIQSAESIMRAIKRTIKVFWEERLMKYSYEHVVGLLPGNKRGV